MNRFGKLFFHFLKVKFSILFLEIIVRFTNKSISSSGQSLSRSNFQGSISISRLKKMKYKSISCLRNPLNEEKLALAIRCIHEDNISPDSSDLQRWIDKYKVTYQLLADQNYKVWNIYNDEGFIPLYIIIDQDMVIRYKDVGMREAAMQSVIEDLLGIN